MDVLESRQQCLGRGLAATSRELREASKSLRKLQRAQAARERLSSHVALILLARHAPDTDLALRYLQDRGGMRVAEAQSLIAKHQDELLKMPIENFANLLEATGQGKAAAKQAQAFADEFALNRWVTEQNPHKGVAPDTKLMLRHLKESGVSEQEPAKTAWKDRSYVAGRKWLQRFRHRWRMSLRKMSCRERLPTDIMRVKARRE